jgi:hypothetical protein
MYAARPGFEPQTGNVTGGSGFFCCLKEPKESSRYDGAEARTDERMRGSLREDTLVEYREGLNAHGISNGVVNEGISY